MNGNETIKPPKSGGSALNDGLCTEIYFCKYCGSSRMYQAFYIFGCLDCCNAYVIAEHVYNAELTGRGPEAK